MNLQEEILDKTEKHNDKCNCIFCNLNKPIIKE